MTILVLAATHIMPTLQCAEAALITESGSYGPGDITNATAINVNQFDHTLWTLNSAMFALQGNLTGMYSFTNTGNANAYAYWGQTETITISYGGTNLFATMSDHYDTSGDITKLHEVGHLLPVKRL